MSDLHGEIMNIPCDPSRAPVAGVNAELAYKYGHRDARHAAAELAAAHGADRAQPAEAEGVEAVEFWVLFDATTPEPYIKKMMPEGFLAFFDHEEDAIRAKSFHPGTDYKRVPYVRQSAHIAALSAVTAERDRLRASKLYWVAPAGSGLVRCVTDERYRKFSPSIRAKYDPVCCVDTAMAAKEA